MTKCKITAKKRVVSNPSDLDDLIVGGYRLADLKAVSAPRLKMEEGKQ